MGIIDPAKVTRLGLQNAGSIASLILTTDCIIVEKPKSEPASMREYVRDGIARELLARLDFECTTALRETR